MFPRAFRIARLGGVDVRVDPSLIFMAGLVLWTFLARFRGGFALGPAIAMAVVGAVAFFLSVLVHELAHAFEARHRDIEVTSVTLFLLGGVTEMHLEAKGPGDEFAISAVGPYASLVTAAAAGLVATLADVFGGPAFAPVAAVAGVIGWLNVLLAVFNLLPGSPLDGGRVFRAAVWAITRDRHRAVRIASRAGQALAVLIGLLAVRLVLVDTQAVFDALILILVAGFMWTAARSELRQDETEELLRGRTVGGLTTVRPPRLPADRPLSQVVDQLAGSPGFEVFPVVAEGQLAAAAPSSDDGPPPAPHALDLLGVLVLEDVLALDRGDRGHRTAAELMRPVDDLPVLDARDPLRELIVAMEQHPIVAVREGGRIASILTARQVAAALRRLHDLERGGRRRGPQVLPHEEASA